MENIEQSFKKNGIPDLLLFSFHGMPQRYLDKGDPYYCFCHKTARLVSEGLDLDDKSYEVAFQSRFGSEQWLEPYIDRLLIEKAKNGIEHIQIISPGFSVDCLETLEEINIQYRELFIENGGKQFEYIPCLNDDDAARLAYALVTTSQRELGYPVGVMAGEWAIKAEIDLKIGIHNCNRYEACQEREDGFIDGLKSTGANFEVVNNQDVIINIQDITGRITSRNTIKATPGINLVTIDTNRLSSGLYFLNVEMVRASHKSISKQLRHFTSQNFLIFKSKTG